MNIERLNSCIINKNKYNELKNQLKSDKNSSYILPKFEKINDYLIIILINNNNIVSSLFALITDNNIMINGLFTPKNYRRYGYSTQLHIWLHNYAKLNKYNKIIAIPLDLSESKFIYEKLGYEHNLNNYFLHLNS